MLMLWKLVQWHAYQSLLNPETPLFRKQTGNSRISPHFLCALLQVGNRALGSSADKLNVQYMYHDVILNCLMALGDYISILKCKRN